MTIAHTARNEKYVHHGAKQYDLSKMQFFHIYE